MGFHEKGKGISQAWGRTGKTICWIAGLFLAAGVVGSSLAQTSGPITEQTVAQYVRDAKTAQDHAQLATYFRTQAAAAGEAAKRHEVMVEAYGKAGKSGSTMKQHCEMLIKSYRDLQKQNEALAEYHEKQGKALGSGK